jgi:hypothetical protein
MGWLRRARGNNSSGHDGISEPRDRAFVYTSSPRFSLLWLSLVLLINSTMASWEYDCTSFSANIPDEPMPRSPFTYPGDDSNDCQSDTSTVVLQNEQSQSTSLDTHSAILDRDRDGDGGQDDLRKRCKDGTGSILTFNNVTTKDQFFVWNRFDMSEDGCQCRCENIEPDDECGILSAHIPYAELCVHLNLDPNEEIIDVTTNRTLSIVWPWELNDDGPNGDPDDYKPYDEYDHAVDMWAYWTEIDARVKIPIHRQGPFEFHYRGTVLSTAQHDPADAGLTPPDDVDDQPNLQGGNEDGGSNQDVDLSGDEMMSKEYTEDPKCSKEVSYTQDIEEEDDDYEDPKDTEIDSYLRYRIVPFKFRNDPKRKKFWTQNARRRYKLRQIGGEDSELRCAGVMLFRIFICVVDVLHFACMRLSTFNHIKCANAHFVSKHHADCTICAETIQRTEPRQSPYLPKYDQNYLNFAWCRTRRSPCTSSQQIMPNTMMGIMWPNIA